MRDRIARLLETYSRRAGESMRKAAALEMAQAMDEGLSAKGISADDLYDLFELAVIYRAVPDYRSCVRAMGTGEWDSRNRARHQREKAEIARGMEWGMDRAAREPADAIDARIAARMYGKRVAEAPGREEVWRWWQTLASCPPRVRMMHYQRELCPYGRMRDVWERLRSHGNDPAWEQWSEGERGEMVCNGEPCRETLA